MTPSETPATTHVGLHVIADFWGARQPTTPEALVATLRGAAEAAGQTIVGEVSHAFTPQGLTGVLLLAESHISLHTWPEIGYMAIDIFTCGETGGCEDAVAWLKAALEPDRVDMRSIERGAMRAPA